MYYILLVEVEADWLANNKRDLITTEVCPQHLTFDDDVKEALRLIMNPPIRYAGGQGQTLA